MASSIEAAAAAAIASINSAAEMGNPPLRADDAIDHVVNAAESTGVAFTAGLGGGASGTVTFTDAADHQAVDVAGNASSTAGLTDGTMKSLLQASDGAGHSTTWTGNSGSLDTDGGVSPTLSVNALNPTQVVSAGETLELASPYSGTISFAGATGTLKIDNSSSFSGTIAGQLVIGDVIDLADITAGASAKISYSGNNSPGTLTVSDGTHTASIALEGNYSLANFTASSDGHGGTAVVDPPALPSGVTLQQISGGPNYYADNGYTYAHNAGWDNPSFFPIGPWLGYLTDQTDANTFVSLDWNTAFNLTANSSLSYADAKGISVIQTAGQLLPGTGAETVGLESYDEPSTFAQGVTTPLSTTPNSEQDGRFWYVGNTWNWIYYGGLNGAPAPGTDASVLATQVTTPNGTTTHIGPSQIDFYWFNAANAGWSYEGGLMLGLSGNATPDEMARGSNYGLLIRNEIADDANNAPVIAVIEDGGSYTQDTSASDYITPPELNWAVWSSIVNGARGIQYFNNTFAGPAQADNNVEDSYYQTVRPGQTVSIYTQIQQTDALILQLAPVINSPTALGYVTVSPAPQTLFSGIETMVKDYNGQFYIFADTRDSLTQTNIPATFTIADKNATSVTVINENRTIPVVNGVFTDTFATAATVHIYEVNDSGVAPPPTPPAAPQITSFSPDTGVVGDGITDANMLTLTGTAVANSTVAVFDGTTQVGTATADGTGAWTLPTAKLIDGSHSFTATDTVSSATSTASSALTVTVDTVAPNAPVETSASIVTGTTKVQLTGTAEANSAITVYDGTVAVGTTTTGANGTWSVTTAALASGAQALTATATDAAGNISVASAALAVTIPSAPTTPAAPTITSFSPDTGVVGDHITNDNTPTLSGTALANSAVTVFDATMQVGTATADASGNWTLTTSALSDGTHNLTATDANSSGTSAPSAAFDVTIDTHAPGAPTFAAYSQAGATVGQTTTLNDLVLKGAAEAGSTIDVFDGGNQIGTATTNSGGAWSYDTGNLANGSHSFTAKAIDAAGNTSAASVPLAETVTAPTPPAPTATKPIDFTNVQENNWNHSFTIKGTADAYSQIKLYDGTVSLGTVTATANGTWSFNTHSLSDTLQTIKAQEIDSAGHVIATSSGAAIIAGSNTSTFTATGGDDFLFSSSSNLNDTFVFASNFGHSTIEGFTVAGSGQDTIQFSKTVFDSFASVLSHATQAGQDVVISTGADTLTLKNIKLGALNSHDFHFA
jgi:Bacterial Ig-like domain